MEQVGCRKPRSLLNVWLVISAAWLVSMSTLLVGADASKLAADGQSLEQTAAVQPIESPTEIRAPRPVDTGKWGVVLASICQDSALTLFNSTGELRQVLSLYESESGEQFCPGDRYAEAFASMRRVVGPDEEHLSDICSFQVYYNIRQFHLKFIHFYKPELTAREIHKLQKLFDSSLPLEPIPRSLRTFFILFAKQVNNLCRIQLVDELDKVVREAQVNEEEFALVEQFRSQRDRLYEFAWAPIRRMVSETTSDYRNMEVVDLDLVDEVDYLSGEQLAAHNGSDASDQAETSAADNKLYLLVKFNDGLRNLGVACQERFRPIYEALFLPVIRLNGLGYVERLFADQRHKKLRDERQFIRWYKIIQTCELLKDIEVLHDASSEASFVSMFQQMSHTTNKADMNRIQLLSKEQADEIRERNQRPDIVGGYAPKQAKFKLEPKSDSRMMWVRELAKAEAELHNFKRDLRERVERKQEHLRNLSGHIRLTVGVFLKKHRRNFMEKDDKTTAGKLANFLTRHQSAIKVVGILLFILVISLHLTLG